MFPERTLTYGKANFVGFKDRRVIQNAQWKNIFNRYILKIDQETHTIPNLLPYLVAFNDAKLRKYDRDKYDGYTTVSVNHKRL